MRITRILDIKRDYFRHRNKKSLTSVLSASREGFSSSTILALSRLFGIG